MYVIVSSSDIGMVVVVVTSFVACAKKKLHAHSAGLFVSDMRSLKG